MGLFDGLKREKKAAETIASDDMDVSSEISSDNEVAEIDIEDVEVVERDVSRETIGARYFRQLPRSCVRPLDA